MGREPVEGRLLIITTGDVRGVGGDARPDVGVEFAPGEFFDGIRREGAKFFVGNRFAAVADEKEIRRQQVVVPEIVNSRDEFARGEIARGAKDDDHSGRGTPVLTESLQERMTRRFGHNVLEFVGGAEV